MPNIQKHVIRMSALETDCTCWLLYDWARNMYVSRTEEWNRKDECEWNQNVLE